VVIYPEGIRAGGSRQGPVDGGLSAAFGIAFEVVLEKAGGFLKIGFQVFYFEGIAYFLFDFKGFIFP
jgi:hypothetical protein